MLRCPASFSSPLAKMPVSHTTSAQAVSDEAEISTKEAFSPIASPSHQQTWKEGPSSTLRAPNCHYLPQGSPLKLPNVHLLFHVHLSSLVCWIPVQGISVARTWAVPWCQSCQSLAATDRQPFRSAQLGEQPLPAHFVIHMLRLLIAFWNGEETDDEQNAAPDKFPSTVNTTHLAVNKKMLSGGAGLCVNWGKKRKKEVKKERKEKQKHAVSKKISNSCVPEYPARGWEP